MLLLPLYPQYSTTTHRQLADRLAGGGRRRGPGRADPALCCYHADPGYVAATAGAGAAGLRRGAGEARPGDAAAGPVLGARAARRPSWRRAIPTSSRSGRPWPRCCGRGAPGVGLDVICYQSRATPQPWLAQHRDRDRAGRRMTGWRCWSADRLRLRAFRDPGGARRGISRGGRPARRSGLFPGSGAEQRPRLHRALAGLARRALGREPGLAASPADGPARRRMGDCPHARAGVALAA